MRDKFWPCLETRRAELISYCAPEICCAMLSCTVLPWLLAVLSTLGGSLTCSVFLASLIISGSSMRQLVDICCCLWWEPVASCIELLLSKAVATPALLLMFVAENWNCLGAVEFVVVDG